MVLLCRYGELALKGKNRNRFQAALVQNMQRALLHHHLRATITATSGRILVFTGQEQEALAASQPVFGLTSISRCLAVPLTMEALQQAMSRCLEGKSFSTFRILTKRIEKRFLPTMDLQRALGKYVQDQTKKKVQLKHPELTITVEIIDQAYVCTDKTHCFGGLPVGVEGRVGCFLQQEADILAAWLLMKRGCSLLPLLSKERDLTLLRTFGCKEPEQAKDFNTALAKARAAKCLAMVAGNRVPAKQNGALPTLYPLAGYGEEEIREKLEEIPCTLLSNR